MAIGFTPKYIEDLYLDEFLPNQFIILAIETARKLGWQVDYINETGFIAFTNNGIFKWNAKITFKIEGEKASVKSESIGNEIIDFGKNKKTIEKFSDTLIDIKHSLKSEDLDKKIEEYKINLIPQEQDFSKPSQKTGKFKDFFSIFIPRPDYFITPILVNVNILVWVAMICSGVDWLSPQNDSLINWGANFRPITLQGEWWRLITNCFLHIGIFHLLMNMYALVYIGLLLEPYLGKTRFIAAYLLTGIIASVTSLWWHDLTISAGASGAIFGIYGVFLAMLTTNLIEKKTRIALLISIGIFVTYNLINGMKGGIDNAAHIGGLLGGILIGYAYFPSLKKTEAINLKYSIIGILSILIVSISFIIYSKLPNDIPKYDEKLKSFISMEQMALEIYRMPRNTSKEKLLIEIKDIGTYYWNENIKLLKELEKLDIPEPLHERNKKLLKYCNLRIKSYELIYKTIAEDTQKYRIEMEDYNRKIENIIIELKGK